VTGRHAADFDNETRVTSARSGARRRNGDGSDGSSWSSVFSGIGNSHSIYDASAADPYSSRDDPDERFVIPSIEYVDHLFTYDNLLRVVNGESVASSQYRTQLVARFHEWAKRSNKLERVFAQLFLTSKIHANVYEVWGRKNLILPFSYELHRPFQTYNMGAMIVAQGGDDLGNTFHGHHDFQWADDVSSKKHIGHYTFRFTPMVKSANLFSVCPDIVAMGDVKGGEFVTFCTTPDEVDSAIRDVTRQQKSIIVKMVPYNVELPRSPQDIAGIWNKSILFEYGPYTSIAKNPIHGQSVYFYDYLLNLDMINDNSYDMKRNFHDSQRITNTKEWLGHHTIYDPNSGSWSMQILDEGNFGKNYYAGYMRERNVIGRPIQQFNVEPRYIYA
jgi:hypothetical protein